MTFGRGVTVRIRVISLAKIALLTSHIYSSKDERCSIGQQLSQSTFLTFPLSVPTHMANERLLPPLPGSNRVFERLPLVITDGRAVDAQMGAQWAHSGRADGRAVDAQMGAQMGAQWTRRGAQSPCKYKPRSACLVESNVLPIFRFPYVYTNAAIFCKNFANSRGSRHLYKILFAHFVDIHAQMKIVRVALRLDEL